MIFACNTELPLTLHWIGKRLEPMMDRLFFLLPAPLRRRVTRGIFTEYALCLLFKRDRMRLPALSLDSVLPAYSDASLTLTQLPRGSWASPVVDVVVLSKFVSALQPVKTLELGSFRGFTALAIAQNCPAGKLVAVDIEPDHGEAYRDRPEADRIERRIGAIGADLFTEDEFGSFDLVFIDADHRYDAVASDTRLAMQLVSPNGWIIWHDYANWGYFSGACGVPEYLAELSEHLPVAQIAGSNMAVHRPLWVDSQREVFDEAVAKTREGARGNVWSVSSPRP